MEPFSFKIFLAFVNKFSSSTRPSSVSRGGGVPLVEDSMRGASGSCLDSCCCNLLTAWRAAALGMNDESEAGGGIEIGLGSLS